MQAFLGVIMAERKYRHPQVNLRLPEELKEQIAKLAEKNGRSANAEMVVAIEHWVSQKEIKLRDVANTSEIQDIEASKLSVLSKDDLMEILEAQHKAIIQYQNTFRVIREKTESAASEIRENKNGGIEDEEFDADPLLEHIKHFPPEEADL
jgi:predicted DNA-binding protein